MSIWSGGCYSSKTIVLNAPALAVLSALPRIGSYVIMGDDPEKSRHDLNRPWKLVSKHAALEGVRLHDLRHTHASFGAAAGLGLPIIGKLLGHAQPNTTQRYAHLDIDPLRRASENIGSRLATAMGDLTTNQSSAEECGSLQLGPPMDKQGTGTGVHKV